MRYRFSIFTICCIFISSFGSAEESANKFLELSKPPQAPRPFNMLYKVSLNGFPTGLKAEVKLRKHQEHYLFELQAKNWILSYFEKSAFHWNSNSPCKLLTEKLIANSQSKNRTFQYEVPRNASDALAYLFKLQCDLKNNNLNPNYKIAYDNGIDHYVFEYQGREKIRTSLGKMETIVLKRVYKNDKIQTTYWIAPELDYLMVKMKHKQGKLVTATLKVKEINYDIEEHFH